MDRYVKEIIDNIEVKLNYIDNEGCYIEYIETNELNKIFNNVVSKQKVKDVIEKYFMEYEKEKEYRFTDDVETEQEILISIENEILEENYDI